MFLPTFAARQEQLHAGHYVRHRAPHVLHGDRRVPGEDVARAAAATLQPHVRGGAAGEGYNREIHSTNRLNV